MIVTEPSINELLHVCDMARSLIDTEDQNVALHEPITPWETEAVQKVALWAEALENLSIPDQIKMAVMVLNKHGVTMENVVFGAIEKVLTISTAHVMEGTAGRLSVDDIPGLVVYEKGTCGWWIWCGVDPDKSNHDDFPDDLWVVLEHATKLGCEWLCLDRDADTIDHLPTWEW